jgi:hypothetical protein
LLRSGPSKSPGLSIETNGLTPPHSSLDTGVLGRLHIPHTGRASRTSAGFLTFRLLFRWEKSSHSFFALSLLYNVNTVVTFSAASKNWACLPSAAPELADVVTNASALHGRVRPIIQSHATRGRPSLDPLNSIHVPRTPAIFSLSSSPPQCVAQGL